MDIKTYEQFFEALHKIVDENVNWTQKMRQFNEYMGHRERMDMDEILSWLEDK